MLPIDIIGDVHGQITTLNELGRLLGYNTGDNWSHPEGRIVIFLGDLIDYGDHGLLVAEMVQGIVEAGNGLCLMGNHEYNLVAYYIGVPGYELPKPSNKRTIKEVHDPKNMKTQRRWKRVIKFLRDMPVSLEIENYRLIHACWHNESIDMLSDFLAKPAHNYVHYIKKCKGPACQLLPFIKHHSPFTEEGLRDGLPFAQSNDEDSPHEILLKGSEHDAPSNHDDAYGHKRTKIRTRWWQEDQRIKDEAYTYVFGHYWHIPPYNEAYAPLYDDGSREKLKLHSDTFTRHEVLQSQYKHDACMVRGTPKAICLDYQGITKMNSLTSCIGALRLPEKEILWQTGVNTNQNRQWTVLDHGIQNPYWFPECSVSSKFFKAYKTHATWSADTPKETLEILLRKAKKSKWCIDGIPPLLDTPHIRDYPEDYYAQVTICWKNIEGE